MGTGTGRTPRALWVALTGAAGLLALSVAGTYHGQQDATDAARDRGSDARPVAAAASVQARRVWTRLGTAERHRACVRYRGNSAVVLADLADPAGAGAGDTPETRAALNRLLARACAGDTGASADGTDGEGGDR